MPVSAEVVLTAVVALFATPVGAPAQDAASRDASRRIEDLLASPVTPVTEVLLIDGAADARVAARWQASLAHTDPAVRSAAARAIRVVLRADLAPALERALATESDALAASEEADALIELTRGPHPAALVAARRFPQPVATTVLVTLLRVAPAAVLDHIATLWPADGDDEVSALVSSLLERDADLADRLCTRLLTTDVDGGWEVVRRAFEAEDDRDVPDDYLAAALESRRPDVRSAALTSVLSRLVSDTGATRPVSERLASLLDADLEIPTSPQADVTRELVHRLRHEGAVRRPLVDLLAAIDDSIVLVEEIRPAARVMTPAERTALHALLPRWALEPRGRDDRPSPRILSVSDLPAGLLASLWQDARCSKSLDVVAGTVDYNALGRPTTIGLPSSVTGACRARVATLLRLGTASGAGARLVIVPVKLPPGFGERTAIRPVRINRRRPAPGDVAPQTRKKVTPQYSRTAIDDRAAGRVIVSAVVGENGRVSQVELLTVLHPDLNAEALSTMTRWEFTPGERNGVKVPVAITVEMSFGLK